MTVPASSTPDAPSRGATRRLDAMRRSAAVRSRDAARSREAILSAAEELFAQRGYDRASLGDIAAAAGLSRGTPSYFFGTKDRLYARVLDRAFTDRQAATAAAFSAVHAWSRSPAAGRDDLARALTQAATDYLQFLLVDRPTFVALVTQEALSGGGRMKSRRASSTAMYDAFTALRQAGPARGVTDFDVEEAILVFVGLTFGSVSYRDTLLRPMGRDLTTPAERRRLVELTVRQLLAMIVGAQ